MVTSLTKTKTSAVVVPKSSTNSGKDGSLSTNQTNDINSLLQQLPHQLDDKGEDDQAKPTELNTSYNPPFTSERALTFAFLTSELSHYLQGYNLNQECLTSKN